MARLKLTEERASAFLEAIRIEDLIETEPHPQDDGEYVLSTKGRAFAMARFTKRFNRAIAKKYVDALFARVTEVNARAELTHRVRGVRVFGSYIEDTDDLGDIDIMVDLEAKDLANIVELSRERAAASGRNMSFFEEISFGETEVKRLIRGGYSRISIHSLNDLAFLKCKSFVLFPEPEDERK